MLLVIIATTVWGKPALNWSAWTTSAGRRFDVRKFESGNKTKTTSPRRQFIVGRHFRSIPVLGKRSETVPQIGGLRRVDPTLAKVHRFGWMNPRHDDARTIGLVQRLQQLHLPVAVDSFDRLHHTLQYPAPHVYDAGAFNTASRFLAMTAR
jgi:hypothetical protein